MIKITEVKCQVFIREEDSNIRLYTADAPTIEMVIEKLGAIERKINKENENV
jgi:hypothetical protein